MLLYLIGYHCRTIKIVINVVFENSVTPCHPEAREWDKQPLFYLYVLNNHPLLLQATECSFIACWDLSVAVLILIIVVILMVSDREVLMIRVD